MLLKILFNYLIGFVNITVEGFFVERFNYFPFFSAPALP